MTMYVYMFNTVWRIYFVGLYFCQFRESRAVLETISTKSFETPPTKVHEPIASWSHTYLIAHDCMAP